MPTISAIFFNNGYPSFQTIGLISKPAFGWSGMSLKKWSRALLKDTIFQSFMFLTLQSNWLNNLRFFFVKKLCFKFKICQQNGLILPIFQSIFHV